MFNRIINFVRDIRIKVDFSRYEKQCRFEHERLAEQTYSTQQLEVELHTKISKIQSEAYSLFSKNISALREEIARIEIATSKSKEMLDIFSRDYKKELNELYEQKDALFSEKENIFDRKNVLGNDIRNEIERKNSAYGSLNHYKDCIDSWYAKSDRTPWLFGNSGKKLPKHSLFGQSFGDLDSHKRHRDAAYEDVQDCKRKIDSLKQEQHRLNERINETKKAIGALVNRINAVKSDRTRLYELKKAGHNKNQLQNMLSELCQSREKEHVNLVALELEQSKFITTEKYRHGVIDLERKIRNIKEQKFQYIQNFDLVDRRKLRMKEHRQEWLNKRNLSP